MSAKLTLAALAAVLTIVSVQGQAFARGVSPSASDLRSDPAFGRLQGTSLGRAPNSVEFGSRNIGRDPDPNVRFQLIRDPARDRL
jgi:hypothetical protein